MVIVFWVSEQGIAVFLKMWSAASKEYATGSQVIRGYISVKVTFKFTYCLNVINNFISNNRNFSLTDHNFISYDCYSTYLRTFCTNYASHTHFNQGQIMQCIVIYANYIYFYLFKITNYQWVWKNSHKHN